MSTDNVIEREESEGTMQSLVIFGIGGFGREIHELIEDINAASPTYSILGFLDANEQSHGTQVHGLPVLGGLDWIEGNKGVAVTLGIGSPSVKARLAPEMRSLGAVFPRLCHPQSNIGRRVSIGEGTIACAGSVLTTDLSLGQFVTLNLNVTIGHDARISDFVTIAPGAHVSGSVTIGTGTDIGTGATIVQGVKVGEWSVIGAGASVVKPIPGNVTAVGVPAKVIKERDPGWHK